MLSWNIIQNDFILTFQKYKTNSMTSSPTFSKFHPWQSTGPLHYEKCLPVSLYWTSMMERGVSRLRVDNLNIWFKPTKLKLSRLHHIA